MKRLSILAAGLLIGAAALQFSSVASGQGENFLIVGAEKLNTIADPTDRSTAILFGDAAGAAVIRKSSGGPRGVLSTFIKSDGNLANLLFEKKRIENDFFIWF